MRLLIKFAPGATGNEAESIKRSVTLRHDGSKIPESQQSFVAETAMCIVERLWKSIGCRFVPEGSHAQESHKCHLFLFFSDMFAGPRLFF